MRAFMPSAWRSPRSGYIRCADNSTPLKRFSRAAAFFSIRRHRRTSSSVDDLFYAPLRQSSVNVHFEIITARRCPRFSSTFRARHAYLSLSLFLVTSASISADCNLLREIEFVGSATFQILNIVRLGIFARAHSNERSVG